MVNMFLLWSFKVHLTPDEMQFTWQYFENGFSVPFFFPNLILPIPSLAFLTTNYTKFVLFVMLSILIYIVQLLYVKFFLKKIEL